MAAKMVSAVKNTKQRSSASIVAASLAAIAVIVWIISIDNHLLTGNAVVGSCFDSDSEEDIYIKGYAEYRSKKLEDTCSRDGIRLQQAYCKSSVKVTMTQSFQCPYGCADGACIALERNCGNGIVDYGEQCDDGNQADGDGCARSCVKEAGFTCKTVSVCAPGS